MTNLMKCVVVLAAFCAVPSIQLATAAEPGKAYSGHKVVRVQVDNPMDVAFIEDIGGDIWSHQPFGNEIDVHVDTAQLDALTRSGLRFETRINNLQSLVDAEQGAARGAGFFDSYQSYNDIVAYLEQLVVTYPNLASMFDVGVSIDGRTIRGIRIAGPNVDEFSPAVIYFTTVHAREWVTTTVNPYLANHLLSNYGIDSQVTDLVDRVEWLLIPVGNPDGYEYTRIPANRFWRKNRRDNGDGTFGVDINRNWGWGWGGTGSSGATNSQIYRGTAPFSEPETAGLRDLFLANPNVRAQLDIHSYSQLILWPWGNTPVLPAGQASYDSIGQTMQQLIFDVYGRNYNIGPIYTAIYPVSGSSLDWTYGERGIWSFSFELRDTGLNGFVLPADQIIPNNEEILPAILHLTGSDEVMSTQINTLAAIPSEMVAGQPVAMPIAITSGVEALSPASAIFHYRYDASGPFKTIPMQQINGAELLAVLPATNCSSTPEFYFSVSTSNGLLTQPDGAPANVYSAVMQQPTTILEVTMDSDPGWTGTGQWEWGQPTGQSAANGEPDPTSGHTGLNVYGYNLNGGYPNNMGVETLTTGAVDCSGHSNVSLSFRRWLGVEQPLYDQASVEVSNDGTNWTTLWSNTATITDSTWMLQNFDISSVADGESAVQIRWTLGPTDSAWTYCGWNIDDVRMTATSCVGLFGDFNGDSEIDLTDHAAFAACMQGPSGGLLPECGVFDAEQDGDVDLADMLQMQNAIGQP
ncbi:MAG: hypothetical protein GXP29_00760 [Planctomycetes bacterium]|nr:hypothetical protein [Planctomycetota bacterium]